jgi:hypothetical protein
MLNRIPTASGRDGDGDGMIAVDEARPGGMRL